MIVPSKDTFKSDHKLMTAVTDHVSTLISRSPSDVKPVKVIYSLYFNLNQKKKLDKSMPILRSSEQILYLSPQLEQWLKQILPSPFLPKGKFNLDA